jgi:hypothetical protein
MAGDSFFNSVVSLLHFNGADGATAFTDVKGKVWTASGNAQIDTAQSKFGVSSGLFDGTGDYISAPSSADFNVLPGDFTLEFYCRFASSGGNQAFFEGFFDTINRWNVSLVAGSVVFYTMVGGTGSIKITATAPAANTWHHIALTKAGATFTLWVNGASVGTSTTASYYSGAVAMYVGSGAGGSPYDGHLDDFRITKGIARYTAGFTPPTAEFPDTAGEVPSTVGVVSLLHFQNADNSQIFTDVMGKEWSVFGNAKNSITQSKFGGLSGYFDGSGDYIASAHPDFGFGSGDWTWESWVRPDAVVGDGYYTNVVSILHFDGVDAATSTTDVKGPLWSFGGTAQLDTAQKKFGTASLLLNGASTDIILVSPNPVFDYGTAAFTIEGWVRTDLTQQGTVWDQYPASGSDRILVYVKTTGAIEFYYDNGLSFLSDAGLVAANTWAHFAVTRNASGVLNIFVNGVKQTNTATKVTNMGATTDVYVGARRAGASPFKGHIDDLRVTKGVARYTANFTPPVAAHPESLQYSLAVADTRAAGAAGLGVYSSIELADRKWGVRTNAGLGAEGSVLTADTWVHLAVAKQGTTIRGFKDGVLDFTYTDARTYALSALATVGANGSGAEFYNGYIDEMRITKGEARYTSGFSVETVPFPDPIDPYWNEVEALLHFDDVDGSTEILDETGRTWTASGNAALDDAIVKFGATSLLLDGTDDFVSTAHAAELSVATGDLTIEAWVRIAVTGKTHTISNKRASSSAAEHGLSVGPTNLVTISAFASGSPVATITSTTALVLDTWVHVAATRQGSTWRLFVNGVLEGTDTQSGAPSTNTQPLRVGRDGFSTARDFQGSIDEYRFTRACRYTSTFTPPADPFPSGYLTVGGGGDPLPVTHAYAFIA